MAEFLTERRVTAEINTATLKIGEFLKLLEVLSPELLDDTLAVAQELKIPIGRATVLRGLLTNSELSNLIQLHCLVRCDIISIEDSKDAFLMARRKGWPIRECLVALGCPIDDGSTVRIGELLMESERISDQDLEMSLELQKLCGLPLGRILTVDACVPEIVIAEALNLQSEIRQRKRGYQDAVSKLKRLRVSNEELDARRRLLLNRFGAADGGVEFTDLLLAGNIVRENDLGPAKFFAGANHMPLGEVLRGFSWVDRDMLSAASALHGLVRDGYVSGQEAVLILRRLRRSDTETLDELPVVGSVSITNNQPVSLYQFLVMSGFLTPDGIRDLIRSLTVDSDLFQEITELSAESFKDKRYMKSVIVKTIVDSKNLEKALMITNQFDLRLIRYARDLLSLIALGIINVNQAILSFARLRYMHNENSEPKS